MDLREHLRTTKFSSMTFLLLIYITVLSSVDIRLGTDASKDSENSQDQLVLQDYELVILGNQLVEMTKYKEAIPFYDEAIKKNPSDSSFYRRRGICYLNLNNFRMAFDNFENAASIATQSGKEETSVLEPAELAKLGKGLHDVWLYKESVWCFTEAIKRNSADVSYYRMRAISYSQTKEFDLAISDFKFVKQSGEQSVDDKIRLSRAFFFSGKFTEAVDEALGLNDVELIKLGDDLKHSAKNPKEAFRCYSAAIEKSPKIAQHYVRRGRCNEDMKDLKSAISDYKEAASLDSENVNNWFLLVSTMSFAEQTDEAIRAETSVLSDALLVGVGDRFVLTRRFKEAVLMYTEAINKNPSEASYYKKRGDTFWKLNDFDRAIEDLREGLRRNRDEKIIEFDRIHLSEVLFDSGKYDETIKEVILLDDIQLDLQGLKFLYINKVQEAHRCFTEAINKNAGNGNYYKNLGLCNRKLKNFKEAISDFRKSLEFNGPSLDVLIDLSEVLVESDGYNEAESILEQIDNYESGSLSVSDAARIQTVRQKMMKMKGK